MHECSMVVFISLLQEEEEWHRPTALSPFLVYIESVQLIFAQDDVPREPAGDQLETENHLYFYHFCAARF